MTCQYKSIAIRLALAHAPDDHELHVILALEANLDKEKARAPQNRAHPGVLDPDFPRQHERDRALRQDPEGL